MYQKYTPSCGSLLKVLVEQVDTNLQYIISKYNSDKWAKKISTRDQLEMMVSANLVQSKSLSDIASMVSGTKKFSCSSINKSSISRVNEKRTWKIFKEPYLSLLRQARKRVGYSNLPIVDTTHEVVSKLLFSFWPWDRFRGAVKVGVSYDPKFQLPDQVVISRLGVDPRRRMKYPTRVIKFWDDKHEEILLLSTNRFDLTTEEIRELYRKRWDIEVFFKFLKQNLKLKKFFGTGKNAIKIQIYCALIAYLLAYLLKPKWERFTEFLQKIRYALFLNYYQLSFFEPP